MTFNVGEIVKMKVARENEYGYFLTLDDEDVMLHKSDLNKEIKLEDEIEVFIFNDKSGRKAATTIIPHDMLDDNYSWATVVSVNDKLGAFLNIGISKDILVSADDLPQFKSVWPAVGDKLFVTLKVDRMNRLFARLATENVILDLAYEATEDMKNKTFRARPYKVLKIGTFALTDEGYRLFIHESQQGSEPRMGQLIEGRIIGITKEGDLNGSLVPRGHERLDEDSQLLLTYIKGRGGSMPFNDKSSPEDITRQFGMSKASFKRALGRLMKFGSVTQVDGWTKIIEISDKKENNQMEFRIEKTSAFKCVGVKSEKLKPFSPEIGQMWQDVTSNGTFSNILSLNDTDFKGIHGFCEPQPGGFIYWIASASSKEAPEGMHKLTIPESTWLIASGEGHLPEAIQKLWKDTFEVFPPSGYRQVQSTCIERYLEFQEDLYSKFEIWIAVEKMDV